MASSRLKPIGCCRLGAPWYQMIILEQILIGLLC
uniref:Uncharacterized protein n=1 Tax=Brassica oleracea TaxID=3712 RepID=A0A3P6FAY2_BRAOL|nr:unnamed protein product [Brassica oleracea]